VKGVPGEGAATRRRGGGGGRGSAGPNAINQWVSMMVHTRRVATTWGVSICGSHTDHPLSRESRVESRELGVESRES